MKKENRLKIINARYKIGEESFDMGFASVIGELKVEDKEGNIIYYTSDEFNGKPEFLKTKKSVLKMLADNDPDDEEKIQELLDNPINDVFEYEELLSKKEDPLYLVYKYLTYIVRADIKDVKKFIKETKGKYLDEIIIPKCDIEEDME